MSEQVAAMTCNTLTAEEMRAFMLSKTHREWFEGQKRALAIVREHPDLPQTGAFCEFDGVLYFQEG